MIPGLKEAGAGVLACAKGLRWEGPKAKPGVSQEQQSGPFWFLGEVTLLPWGPRNSARLCSWKEHTRSRAETPERHSSQGVPCFWLGRLLWGLEDDGW